MLVVEHLISRLLELEWLLQQYQIPIYKKNLPLGVFKSKSFIATDCIAEIKTDLALLAKTNNANSQQYLAKMCSQKINILLGLFKLYKANGKNNPNKSMPTVISTYQQRLSMLQNAVAKIDSQIQALTKHLQAVKPSNLNLKMQLEAELGRAQRHKTELQEAFLSLQ